MQSYAFSFGIQIFVFIINAQKALQMLIFKAFRALFTVEVKKSKTVLYLARKF